MAFVEDAAMTSPYVHQYCSITACQERCFDECYAKAYVSMRSPPPHTHTHKCFPCFGCLRFVRLQSTNGGPDSAKTLGHVGAIDYCSISPPARKLKLLSTDYTEKAADSESIN